MIKGTQKQMIVLRTGESRYFDEAYFVLRREIKNDHQNYSDILREANRILEESRFFPNDPGKSNKKRRMLAAIAFLAGALCGIGLGVLLGLLF